MFDLFSIGIICLIIAHSVVTFSVVRQVRETKRDIFRDLDLQYNRLTKKIAFFLDMLLQEKKPRTTRKPRKRKEEKEKSVEK